MKRAKGVLANLLTVLFTLSAFLLAGFIAVIVPATSNSFYKTQFRKHGTLEKVRAQSAYIDDADAKNYVANMTEEQLLSLMNHTMRYCLYLEDDLNIEKWLALNLKTKYYTTKLHVGAFYLPAFLEKMLEEVEK